MTINPNNRGITLIEAIIYTALLALVLIGAISLALNMVDLKVRHLAMRDVLAGGRWANTAISQKIRTAASISSPASGEASSSLELLYSSGDTAKIFLSAGRLWLSQNAGSSRPFTAEYLRVSNVVFSRALSGSRVDNVNYEFVVGTDKAGAFDYSISLNSSASTR